MKKNLISICVLIVLVGVFGCKKKDIAVKIEADYQPASPAYVAKYDYSVPPVNIDVERALARPAPLKLSQIASQIEYYTVGDSQFPVTQVLAIPEGILTFNNPRTYLCRKGMKRKRIAFKTLIGNWNNVMGGKNLYYDKATTRLYCSLFKLDTIPPYINDNPYIGALPPFDSVLPRTRHIFPDSLSNRFFHKRGKESMLAFSSTGYVERHRDKITGTPIGITTFNLLGDTLCLFDFGVEVPKSEDEIKRHTGLYHTSYWYEDQLTFRLYLCDTIFRLRSPDTVFPAYSIHMGKYRASTVELLGNTDLEDKAWMESLTESPKGVFLGIYQEGEAPKIDWEGEASVRKLPRHHQVVYFKPTRKTVALPIQSRGLVNDLDDGLPFWPDGQTEEYLYMIRPASALKEGIKLTGTPKQQELKAFLDQLPITQNVMIIVK